MKKLSKLIENFKQNALRHGYEREQMKEACPNLTRLEGMMFSDAAYSTIDAVKPMTRVPQNDGKKHEEILKKECMNKAALEKQWEAEKSEGTKFIYSRDKSRKIIRTEIKKNEK